MITKCQCCDRTADVLCSNAAFSVAVLCDECSKRQALGVVLLGLWPTPAKVAQPSARRGKPRATPPDGFAQRCFDALVAACRELSPGTAAGPRRLTPGMQDSLAKLYAAEAPTDEEWAAVVRRRLELDRANAGYGALTWEHLCRPANFRRYRDEAMGLPTAETDTNIDEMPAWAMGSDA